MKDIFRTGTPSGEPLLAGSRTVESFDDVWTRIDPEIKKQLDRIEGMLRELTGREPPVVQK